MYIQIALRSTYTATSLLTLGACASEGYSSWSVCVCVRVSVCLSGLNQRLQGSRATSDYSYVFLTMNARFNMCGVRYKRTGRKL